MVAKINYWSAAATAASIVSARERGDAPEKVHTGGVKSECAALASGGMGGMQPAKAGRARATACKARRPLTPTWHTHHASHQFLIGPTYW
jgi:hypothetical protein